MLETKQEIPDFLTQYIPATDKLSFEADSDFDPTDMPGAGEDGCGGDGGDGGWGDNSGGQDASDAFGNMGENVGWGEDTANQASKSTSCHSVPGDDKGVTTRPHVPMSSEANRADGEELGGCLETKAAAATSSGGNRGSGASTQIWTGVW